jgi:hypothetical protein
LNALAQDEATMLLPIVTANTINSWEGYTATHRDWLNTSLQGQTSNYTYKPDGVIRSVIFNDEGPVSVNGATFLPVWQIAPALPLTSVYNFDMLSSTDESIATALQAVLSTEKAVIVHFFDISSIYSNITTTIFREIAIRNGRNISEPIGLLFYPIFSSYDVLVGVAATSFYWRNLLADSLPDDAKSMQCVLQGPNHSVTYQVDGTTATFVGTGDLHNKAYDKLLVKSDKQAVGATGVDQPILYLYPSQDNSNNVTAALYACIVAVLFLFTFFLFVTYDCLVQHRLKNILASALRSHRIVRQVSESSQNLLYHHTDYLTYEFTNRSLFPLAVRERLFNSETDECSDVAEKDDTENGLLVSNEDEQHRKGGLVREPAKHNLKTFLKEGSSSDQDDSMQLDSKPIADFFPHCTVMFSDISGFTVSTFEC